MSVEAHPPERGGGREGSSSSGEPVRRVVLVGFMCSGKSTVGPALAARLGWEHLDLDREVERRAGRSVSSIFAEEGEAAFRAREAEATAALAGRERVVLSPGGGWITNPALLAGLGPGTLSVWLRVSADEVMARSAAQPGERPLLRGPDPLATVRRLLGEREPLYARADLAVETGGRDPGTVVEEIVRAVERRGVVVQARHVDPPGLGVPPDPGVQPRGPVARDPSRD